METGKLLLSKFTLDIDNTNMYKWDFEWMCLFFIQNIEWKKQY